jgi:hypothetical protein
MKCPKKNKTCQACLVYKAQRKDNFICSGINFKPTNYKKDNIWLCLHGATHKLNIEITVEEALYICSVLQASLGFLAPGVINDNIKHQRHTRKAKKIIKA